MKRLGILTFLFVMLCCFFAAPVYAQKPDMKDFRALPILHEGRIKPLGSFAHITLKQISGKSRINDLNAEEWLALSLFDPTTATNLEIFMLGDTSLQKTLALSENKKHYSLAELSEGLNKTLPQAADLAKRKDENFSPAQTALLKLHENAALYTEILRSFSALLPLDLELPEKYKTNLPAGPHNYLTLQSFAKNLDADLKNLIRKKGMNPKTYKDNELKTAEASFRLSQLRQAGEHSHILRVIPGNWENEKTHWFSPWALFLEGAGSPAGKILIEHWADLAKAYRSGDAPLWANTARTVSKETYSQAGSATNQTRIKAELMYRELKPYNAVTVLYSLGFLIALFMHKRRSARALWIPLCTGITGIALHGLSIIARIYILGRPPVGTLYESVLFVSLICAAIGVSMTLLRKNTLPLMAGLAAAAMLLLIAPVALPKGDNLEVLVAVLNTNFWLATHVLCITAGYGICILTACLGHIALAHNTLPPKFYKTLYQISLSALLFMAVGTALGGIWADQSWGRFWGWDPKENGALLICLWLIWVQHGRLSGHLNQTAFIAMLAALNVIVALSWFGVNLLNVGLHSYGFTSGMAAGLTAFCAAEALIIGGLWLKKTRANTGESKHAA